MNYRSLIILSFVTMALSLEMITNFFRKPEAPEKSIYEFKMSALDGRIIDFNQFKGKNILIVNTASKCKYTPQYAELQKLHELHGGNVFVLGFPANNFLWQEPGSEKEIESFCKSNYGVTFQMFQKISVKGRKKHPIYRWLESRSGHSPSWNFCKYLIDKKGDVVAYYSADVSPLDKQIIEKIST